MKASTANHESFNLAAILSYESYYRHQCSTIKVDTALN
jgi:hypothetical protein